MEWKVGNISMLRKGWQSWEERKLVCLLLDLVGFKKQSMFLRHATHNPPPAMPSPFSVCDLTLPKQNSKENQFILGGKSRL